MTTPANQSRTGIPRNRAPQGTVAKRLLVALLPDEREELDRLADLDNRTHSAMARIFLLRGMQADPAFKSPAEQQGK